MSFQPTLFDDAAKAIAIPLVDGDMMYYPQWLHSLADSPLLNQSTAELYTQLRREVMWEQTEIVLYGKTLLIPRLNAWYGDPQCGYTYSGKHFESQPWLPLLLTIKLAVEKTLAPLLNGCVFNSALVNCYRDGQDSVAWHSDDEPELGQNPLVASVSLGAARQFQLRHKYNKQHKHTLSLDDGDLVLMYGTTQHYWQHQIPKTTRVVGERINITFRLISR